ncbi:hypothetical protein [Flavobacterium soyangense]|uniref:Uncharacterized protein n=1 Tax=Flavobacterium soyangense TaxID=2023265 RepID=A0A930UB53_9FLAO|nr:hypothetical protein [Flavobacterium soyangense]MBF2707622.1 hypothetical protein [Flavobacterium soyangense]
MESNKIESLLEKYFRGETSISEEIELRDYFSSLNVSPNIEQYKPLFDYLILAKEQNFEQEMVLKSTKRNLTWLSIAASVVVLLGIGTYSYFNYNNVNQDTDLGTYDNPEIAFRETQKALSMLSTHLNTGIESVQYIQEYENSKNLIFKQQ